MQITVSRRRFVKNSAFAGAALLASPAISLAESAGKKNISIQLYSVREDMKNNPLATLQALSKMGYRQVEHANYRDRKFYGYSPKEFKKILADLGMKMTSGHTLFGKEHWNATAKQVTDLWKVTLEDAAIVGQKHIISPWFPWDKKNIDEVKIGIEGWNYAGMEANKMGLRFGFHNHHQEFEEKFDGKTLYEIMLQESDLKYVCQQLDICNMSIAQADPIEWMSKYARYFESIHVKDLSKDSNESTVLGDGRLDMPRILEYAKNNCPVKYWIIEQEAYGNRTPLECAALNLDRLKNRFKL
ncbi:MAG: sugar phosphate isomerase/epimerase [Cytophagales bacterium]|nr:sugar phosphate isomerase/epimerase [Bernardetiaceae bacterium]MDW8204132.1 sugar phosphate isomerase/epimerase [Cytophagales bacterium]